MRKLVLLLAVALISGICFADIAPPSFYCPSGQTENLQCASACCSQAGGTYNLGEETCTGSYSELTAAFQCEEQRGCCEGGSPNPSGCCGSALVLFAGLGLLGFAAWKR